MIRHQDPMGLQMTLALGPGRADGDWTDGQLRRGWAAYGADVLARASLDRPWAWFRFQAGEEMPENYPERLLRLLDLGELSAAERHEAGRVALETLRCIQTMTHDPDEAGAVTQVVAGHVVRKADAAVWQRVLEAVN